MKEDTRHDQPDVDWELLRAFADRGDVAAFRALYERYHRPIGRFALEITGRVELAEEVVAEAFATLVEAPPLIDTSFRAYLFTVVRRKCIDVVRRRQTADRLATRWPSPEGGNPDVERGLLVQEQEHAVRRAVSALPEVHREVLALYYGQDLTSVEVAQVLGCTGQQVRSRLAYARRLLRDALVADALGRL